MRVRDDVDQSCDHVRDFEKHSVLFESIDDGCVQIVKDSGVGRILAPNAAVT